MRHNVFGRKLNRNIKQRKALFRSLFINLVLKGRIITTEAKAKAVRRFIDKIITQVKKQTLASRRLVLAEIPNKDVFEKLYKEMTPLFKERVSGFTRMIKIGERKGDKAEMVILEWVRQPLNQEENKKNQKQEIS